MTFWNRTRRCLAWWPLVALMALLVTGGVALAEPGKMKGSSDSDSPPPTQAPPTQAAPVPESPPSAPLVRVGKVIDVKGRLSYRRAGQAAWCSGFVQMPACVRDRLRTDDSSMAALDLDLGARIGLNKGTEIELVGSGELTTLVVRKGTIWARFDKQPRRFAIRTPSTIIGIRGTEFVVEAAANQETSVEVLGGEVGFAPAQAPLPEDSAAVQETLPENSQVAGAGSSVTLAWQGVPVVHSDRPEDLRRQTSHRYSDLDTWYVRSALYSAASYVPYGWLGVDVILDPNRAATHVAATAAERGIPGVGGSILGGLIRAGSSSQSRREPDFPHGLRPDQGEASSDGLTFSWQPYQAQEFFLLVSRDEKMATIDWSAQVSGNSVVYPRDAMPLARGQRYYWRVIGLDKGKPRGKAAQTWFVAK